jgi:hypothetical protein
VAELLEDIEFADEAAARRFDLTQVARDSAWVDNCDSHDPVPYMEFFDWAAVERWRKDGDEGTAGRP